LTLYNLINFFSTGINAQNPPPIFSHKGKEGSWEDEKIGSWEKEQRKEDDRNHPNEKFLILKERYFLKYKRIPHRKLFPCG
jgi:hypothetical protein